MHRHQGYLSQMFSLLLVVKRCLQTKKQDILSQNKSSQPYCHMTNHHTNILSQDKSSQGLIVKGQMVTGTFCYSEKTSHGYFVTWAYRQSTNRHTEILSPDILSQYKLPHGHIVTRQIITRTYCHQTFCHSTNCHTDILSQDKSSHEHIATRYIFTRTGIIEKTRKYNLVATHLTQLF